MVLTANGTERQTNKNHVVRLLSSPSSRKYFNSIIKYLRLNHGTSKASTCHSFRICLVKCSNK